MFPRHQLFSSPNPNLLVDKTHLQSREELGRLRRRRRRRRIHIYIYTNIHTYIHTYTHKYIHVHTKKEQVNTHLVHMLQKFVRL